MRGNRKKKTTHQIEKPMTGKSFVCFLILVKETAKECGPFRFVIIDKNESETQIHITKEGEVWINGKKNADSVTREYIAKNAGDFERLFLESVKKHDADLHIMPKLYLAKLTDLSGTYEKPATVKIYDGKKTCNFKIERTGFDGRFFLDDIEITKAEAAEYVEAHYGEFLVEMKAAKKAMKDTNKFENNKFPSTYGQIAKKKIKHSEIVDGKLQVDIDSFLPQKKKKLTEDYELTRSKDVISAPKRGYIK